MKKTIFLSLLMVTLSFLSYSQNIGIGTTTPDPSAMLDITSGSKGLLIPRVGLTATNSASPIAAPANSLLVYNTATNGAGAAAVVPGYYYWNGSAWLMLNTAVSSWQLTGNAGTTVASNFLGTTDNNALLFKVNNTKAGYIGKAASDGNVFWGYEAGLNNTSYSNVGLGIRSLYSNTTSSHLIAIGDSALYNNTSGDKNIAIGSKALYANTTGYQNTGIGDFALSGITTGILNTAVGGGANDAIRKGNENVAIGFWAGRTNDSASNNVSIGSNAAYYNNRSNITVVGFRALYKNSFGSTNLNEGIENTAVGYMSQYNNTLGISNTSNGFQSLYSNTIGSYNTATGYNALYSNTTGGENTANGYSGLTNNTTGVQNTAIGSRALTSNTTGNTNTATGWHALDLNTTGSGNTASGRVALSSNITGIYNTAIGYFADVASGGLTNATAIGSFAKVYSSNTMQLGDNNVTDIYAGADLNTLHAANIKIQKSTNSYLNIVSPSTNESGLLFGYPFDNTHGGIIYNNTTFPQDANGMQFRTNGNITRMVLYSSGNAWLQGSLTQNSDIRLKKDIHPISGALNGILKLSGYTYHWKDKEATPALQSGLIAQEVQKIFPELVSENQGKLGINYSGLIPYMLEAAKEQQVIIEKQNTDIALLKKQVEALSKIIQAPFPQK